MLFISRITIASSTRPQNAAASPLLVMFFPFSALGSLTLPECCGCQRRLHHLQKTALRESDYQLEAPHSRNCKPYCELHEAYGSGDGVDLLTSGPARRVSILVSVTGASVGRAITMRTWQQWLLSVGLVSACTMGMTYKS